MPSHAAELWILQSWNVDPLENVSTRDAGFTDLTTIPKAFVPYGPGFDWRAEGKTLPAPFTNPFWRWHSFSVWPQDSYKGMRYEFTLTLINAKTGATQDVRGSYDRTGYVTECDPEDETGDDVSTFRRFRGQRGRRLRGRHGWGRQWGSETLAYFGIPDLGWHEECCSARGVCMAIECGTGPDYVEFGEPFDDRAKDWGGTGCQPSPVSSANCDITYCCPCGRLGQIPPRPGE